MKKTFRIGIKTLLLIALSLTLSACFTRSALISFESNGGTPVRDIMVPFGEIPNEPDEPTKEGYVFIGWFSDKDLTNKYTFEDSVEDNMTLYAKWDPAKYTITWDTNGGSEIEPSKIGYKMTVLAPTQPKKEGYIFGGWYYEKEFDNLFDFQTTMPAKDFTLYARWSLGEFKVTLNTNGGSPIDPITDKYGEDFEIPATNKVGHTFKGWYLDSEFKEEFKEYKIPASDITLYAKWEAIDITVTFFIYEGKFNTETVKYNQTAKVPNTPERAGYTFKEWKLEGETYDFETPVREDITLKADWEINLYKVTFNTFGGSLVDFKETQYNTTILEPLKPTKTGHEFVGWFKDAGLNEAWNFTEDRVLSNITLYAKWKLNSYRIQFVTGAEMIPAINQEFGTVLTEPKAPALEGHEFAGWYLDSAHTKPYIFPDTMPAENLTLYARWTTNDYQLIYQVDGEVYRFDSIPFGSEINLIENPEKMGHTFIGWDGLPDTMPARDVTVNAVFAINSYQGIYYVDGEEYQRVNIKYGEEIIPLVEPTKTGYTFSGWSEIPLTMPADDIVISGDFVINFYEILIQSNFGQGTVSVIPTDSPVAYNTELTVRATPEAGYKFSHWHDGKEIRSTETVFTFTMPAEDLVLTAFFVAEDNVEYRVIYYGESLDGTGYGILDSIKLYGTTEDLVEAESRSIPGFTFDIDYEGNVLRGNVLGDGSLILHVYYSRNSYTLTYLLEGVVYLEVSYKFEEEIIELEDPTKEGYQFMGWNLHPDKMPAENISISGSYGIVDYSITYQLDGGSFSLNQPEKYNINSDFSIANPTKLGFTFLGWTFAGEDVPVKDFRIIPGRTGNLNLIANWKEIDYLIQYFDGADLLSLNPNTYTINDEVILPIPTKTGHTFLGYYDNSEFMGEAITVIPLGSTGNKSFHANFKADSYRIYYYNGSELINDLTLINEYTYSEYEDLVLVTLPELTGHSFTWEDGEGNPIARIPAGSFGEITLYSKYTAKSYDVSFYNENGDLIGTVYDVIYDSEITLTMALNGEPTSVEKLIELNQNILLLNQGILDLPTFQIYLMENAAQITGISKAMALALQRVMTEQNEAAIQALMQAGDAELSRLAQALDIKINLLQTLKTKIEEVVQGGSGEELFLYIYAAKGAFTSYSEELALQIGTWLASLGTDMDAFEQMNGLVSMELINAAMIRQTYRKNHPSKNGYAFIGWKLGSGTLYLTHGEGYTFNGSIVMAPASNIQGTPAKLIAVYRRLQGLESTFSASDNRLNWSFLSNEILSSLYDEETETIEVEYEIYLEDINGNISYFETTVDNKISLTNLGTYQVKVIPVVRIYENGELINTVSASISNAIGLEVTVKKMENEAVLESSGKYYHKVSENNETVYYFFSNTEITFPSSSFTILSGSEYVTVKNQRTLVFGNSYTTENQAIEFTFTASEGGTEYLGRIYPYISQYELGENLTHYNNTTEDIENTLYYDKEVKPYYVGKAIIGADETDIFDNDNAFYFDLLIKTTGGKKIELPAAFLDFKAYEIVDGVEEEVIIRDNTSGDWQIYRFGKYFYFRESGKVYRVSIGIKNAYFPRELKDSGVITEKSFVITTNDSLNVFTNEELKQAYANTLVKGINIHRNIEAKLNQNQTYVDPDDGITYPYNLYAGNVITLYNNNLAHKSGNVYQRISAVDSENPDNLVINGNYFAIDGSKLPYCNYEPGEIGIEIPGGTIIGQVGPLSTVPGYKVRNVQIAIFNHIGLDLTSPIGVNYGGVTYNNLTVIGNTRTPNVNYSEGAGKIEEALEIMGRNSGGYVAIASNYNLTLAVDNVVVGASTIAIWSNTESEVIVNNTHVYNSWANSMYSYGARSLSVANAILETSGGAAIHYEDTKFTKEYEPTINFDTQTVEVNNWVSGEEPWFKAHSMELAAMQMKAQINSGVSALDASILRTITDPNTNLTSRKMNFIMLILPESEQLSPSEALQDEAAKNGTATEVGYSDVKINMLQSSDWYDYDVPYGDKYLVQISENLFLQVAGLTGQTYNSVALPFGEIRPIVLDTGISDLGTNIYTNYLAVQADLSSVSRGHGILVVGLDKKTLD